MRLQRSDACYGVSVMPDRGKKVFFLILMFSIGACVKKDPPYNNFEDYFNQTCSFAGDHGDYHVSEASIDASNEFEDGSYHLIKVADGIGPSTPGLEMLESMNTNEVRCLGVELQNGKEVMLWVGADHEFCKERAELSEKATSYASSFNRVMLEKMILNKLNECETFK